MSDPIAPGQLRELLEDLKGCIDGRISTRAREIVRVVSLNMTGDMAIIENQNGELRPVNIKRLKDEIFAFDENEKIN